MHNFFSGYPRKLPSQEDPANERNGERTKQVSFGDGGVVRQMCMGGPQDASRGHLVTHCKKLKEGCEVVSTSELDGCAMHAEV
eukprot:1158720-Pelagomonas_calceolata.AAC.5